MTFSAEFHCHRGDFTISADQMCDGINDCPGADEAHYNCPDETEDEDNTINEIASKNQYPQNVSNTSVSNRDRIKFPILLKCPRDC